MRTIIFAALLTIATAAFASDESRKIVISLAGHKLALIEEGRPMKIYPVAVGKPSTPSPTGTFEIVSRVVNPTWYGPHEVVAPGPANPLGTRWIGLSQKGYGIHGTNAPHSVGKSASHGCIRMRKQDLEELFELVQTGDKVELVEGDFGELANIFAAPQFPNKLPLPRAATFIQQELQDGCFLTGTASIEVRLGYKNSAARAWLAGAWINRNANCRTSCQYSVLSGFAFHASKGRFAPLPDTCTMGMLRSAYGRSICS